MISAGLLVAIAEAAVAIAGFAQERWRAGAAYRAAKLQAKIEFTDRWRRELGLKRLAQRGRRRRWAEASAVARAWAATNGGRCGQLKDEVRRRVALAVEAALDERRRAA